MQWYIYTLVFVIVAVSITRIVIVIRNKALPLSKGIAWILIWLVIGIIFWDPEIASFFAQSVGIGRGADAVVYTAIIIITYLLYRIFVRFEKIEREITLLNRDNALMHGERKDTSSTTDHKF